MLKGTSLPARARPGRRRRTRARGRVRPVFRGRQFRRRPRPSGAPARGRPGGGAARDGEIGRAHV